MNRSAAALLLLSALPLAAPARAEALSAAQREEVVRILRETLVRDPSILREALMALQADEGRRREAEARQTLAQLGPKLVTPADPVAGNPLGDVTVVEFFDTRCPYCRAMNPVMAELLRGDPRLRVVPKDMPVLGPASQLESQALMAAQKQGGYFKLRDAIMTRPPGPSSRDSLRELADGLGLDGAQMLRDMDDPAIKARIEANLALARSLQIEGTPAFVVGAQLIPGATSLAELQRAVAQARSKAR